jgi:hypothetical protein
MADKKVMIMDLNVFSPEDGDSMFLQMLLSTCKCTGHHSLEHLQSSADQTESTLQFFCNLDEVLLEPFCWDVVQFLFYSGNDLLPFLKYLNLLDMSEFVEQKKASRYLTAKNKVGEDLVEHCVSCMKTSEAKLQYIFENKICSCILSFLPIFIITQATG